MNSLQEILRSTKVLIASITGLVVVLAAFINSGRDLYLALSGAPRTAHEETNSSLFAKHFQESPAFTQPLNVDLENLTMKGELDAYKSGDVYVKLGNTSGWFAFSPLDTTRAAFWLRAAYAGGEDTPSGKYTQKEREDRGRIVRERLYENGVLETLTIDKNTGQIVRRSLQKKRLSPEEKAQIERGVPLRGPIEIKIK